MTSVTGRITGVLFLIFIMVALLCVMYVYFNQNETDTKAYDAAVRGYADGYNQHNETIYAYCAKYAEYQRSIISYRGFLNQDIEYQYDQSYCNGYNKWIIDSQKPVGFPDLDTSVNTSC